MKDMVTDEMIARYLSGKATPEEEKAVLDYMSEDDERLDDLLAMTASVERFGTKKEKKHIQLWSVVSAAACVALLIGLGIAFWYNGGHQPTVGIDPAPAYAEQDSITDSVSDVQILGYMEEGKEDTL